MISQENHTRYSRSQRDKQLGHATNDSKGDCLYPVAVIDIQYPPHILTHAVRGKESERGTREYGLKCFSKRYDLDGPDCQLPFPGLDSPIHEHQ